jgi:hypothetical protein
LNRRPPAPKRVANAALAQPLGIGIFALSSSMLSDRDAEEIERGRREGVGGPIVLKWLDQLLSDRKKPSR